MDLNFLKKKLLKSIEMKKKIFVLGRGFSTSLFLKNIKQYKSNIIIGFNTDEIIEDLDFYFTNKQKIDNKIPNNKLFEIKKIYKYFNRKYKIYKIGSIKYSIETILHLINYCVKNIEIKNSVEIVFVGFDFRTSLPEGDYKIKKRQNIIQSHIDISGQRDLFFKRKNSFKKLKIYHAGFDHYSDFDPRDNLLKKKITQKKFYTKIVAEITTNHHGETTNLLKLIYGAKKAGADYVKFQMRDVASFYPKKILNQKYESPYGKTFEDYRNQLELSDEQIKLIIKECKKIKIKPFFSILDIKSFKKLQKYKFDLYKIPSTISEDKKFLNYIKNNYKGELVVSTGMTKKSYLLKCAKLFKNNKKLYLMHCVSSYPTMPSDANISIIDVIRNLTLKYKNIIPGYSSHDLTEAASALAIASGARLLEKHIKISSKKWAHFDETALDVNYEFPSWVQYMRSTEKLLGNQNKRIYSSEHHKYFFKKN